MTGHERLALQVTAMLEQAAASMLERLAVLTPREATTLARHLKVLAGGRLCASVHQMRRADVLALLVSVSVRIDDRAPDPVAVELLRAYLATMWPDPEDTSPAPAPRSRRLMRANHLRSVP